MSNHMLVIIQRVPRYEMLFKDYLKKLPEDSLDREESESKWPLDSNNLKLFITFKNNYDFQIYACFEFIEALEIIRKAAVHSNEALNKIKKFKEILEVEKKLGNVLQLVSPTRQLLKEGDLQKISKADNEHHTRHIYLVRYRTIFSLLILVL